MKRFSETTSYGFYQNQYILQRYSGITTVDELMRRLCKNSSTQNDVHNKLFFIQVSEDYLVLIKLQLIDYTVFHYSTKAC